MKKVFIIITTFLLVFVASCTNNISETTTTTSETTTEEETVIVDYTVLNKSFETDIDRVLDLTWDTFQSDSMYQRVDTNSSEGDSSLEMTSMFGGFLSVWQVIPIEGANYRDDFDNQMTELKSLSSSSNTTLPEIGDKIELSVDIFIDELTEIDNTTPFLVYVESEDVDGNKTIIAESDVVDINRGEWTTLTTKPAANSGVIPEDSVLIVISIQVNIPEDGIIYLDNAAFGKRVKEDEVVDNSNPTYSSNGVVYDLSNNSFEQASPFVEEMSYVNDAYYGEYAGIINSNSSNSIELDYLIGLTNETLSAGIWLKRTTSTGEVSLKLEAYYEDEYHIVDTLNLTETGVWNYLKTNGSDLLEDKTIEKIKITITNGSGSQLLVDYLQVGDYQAFNGNPQKMAFIAYQPWYDSESEGWGNWQYTDASDYDGGVNSYPSRYNDDGLRDIASVYYPLIGVYDSSDREVIEYHLQLIKAMNIDVIQVNYYADLSQNMLDSLAIIFELAEEYDLKVSILYEPKIHIYGWIPHATRMEALDAVEQDIKDFIDRYGDSKALFKIDNLPVIEIFGVNIIRNSEWNLIIDNILEEEYELYLMGDSIQNSDYSSMKGMFQWNLYESNLASATIAEFGQHIIDINTDTLEWAAKNVGYNLPIGIVYPGFDDTKVLGWDLGVARKIDLTGPDLYQEAWDQFNSMEGFDYVLVATFNDWNEGTIIEPELTWGHEMAIITQKEVADFKGTGIIDSQLLEDITNTYLNNRQNQYD